eukprot:Awhi_evm1s5937
MQKLYIVYIGAGNEQEKVRRDLTKTENQNNRRSILAQSNSSPLIRIKSKDGRVSGGSATNYGRGSLDNNKNHSQNNNKKSNNNGNDNHNENRLSFMALNITEEEGSSSKNLVASGLTDSSSSSKLMSVPSDTIL